MVLNKPKRLVAVINGFEIGVESPDERQDAVAFDQFCEALRAEIKKFVTPPAEVASA